MYICRCEYYSKFHFTLSPKTTSSPVYNSSKETLFTSNVADKCKLP